MYTSAHTHTHLSKLEPKLVSLCYNFRSWLISHGLRRSRRKKKRNCKNRPQYRALCLFNNVLIKDLDLRGFKWWRIVRNFHSYNLIYQCHFKHWLRQANIIVWLPFLFYFSVHQCVENRTYRNRLNTEILWKFDLRQAVVIIYEFHRNQGTSLTSTILLLMRRTRFPQNSSDFPSLSLLIFSLKYCIKSFPVIKFRIHIETIFP